MAKKVGFYCEYSMMSNQVNRYCVPHLKLTESRRLRETPQHAIAAMTPHSGLTEDEFQAALDGLIIPDVEANAALLDGASASLGATVERLAGIMLERGLLVRPPEVSGLLDGRFVRTEGRER